MKNKKRILILVIAIIVIIVILGLTLSISNGYKFMNYRIKDSVSGITTEFSEEGLTEKQLQKKQRQDAWLATTSWSKINITSKDGLNMVAYEILQNTEIKSDKWVVLIHGYTSRKETLLDFAKVYYEHGYNVILPDLRAQGESEGVYTGMGWLEKNDILLWIDNIISTNPNAEIVLHGVSMGAATAMMTAGESSLQDNVVAAVEDCGYTSMWDISTYEALGRYNFLGIPTLFMASVFSDLNAGYSFTNASALEQVKHSKIPILFIHGDEDKLVPVEMVYELYDAAVCEKELLVVKGAGHGGSESTDQELYWTTVFDFVEQ